MVKDTELKEKRELKYKNEYERIKKISEYFQKGRERYQDKDYEGAIEMWEKIVELCPENKTILKGIELAKGKMEKSQE